MEREEKIKLIAYQIWEEEGCINGRDCEHWFKAEAVWEQQQKQKDVTQSHEVGSKNKTAIKQSTKTIVAKKKSQKT